MRARSRFLAATLLTSMIGVAVAASSWQKKEDPSQWTSEDVYQILNNSPWSKAVKVTVAPSASVGPRGVGTWDEGMPPVDGRGGYGGMGRGMGRGRGGYPHPASPTVTVQWESALPVRLAEAKLNHDAADPGQMQSLNEYRIAVIGLPKSGFAPKDASNENYDDASLAEHLKVITVLSFAHERLNPSKVDLNQNRDGRVVFHFEKASTVEVSDKSAEFRITSTHMEVRQKFALKDMEYQRKLEL